VGEKRERKRVEDCRNEEENDESLAVEKRRRHGKRYKPELGFTREDEANYRKKKNKVVGLSFCQFPVKLIHAFCSAPFTLINSYQIRTRLTNI